MNDERPDISISNVCPYCYGPDCFFNGDYDGEKFGPADGETEDLFGTVVSISDNKMAVGAYGNDDNGAYSGAVYIYRFINNQWVEEQKITASDGQADDWFGGMGVAISGNKLLVGAHGVNNIAGAVYAFKFNGESWVEEQKIIPIGSIGGDCVGSAVKMDGDVAIIGSLAKNNYTGCVWIYRFDGDNWRMEQKITASDGQEMDAFGYGVAISDKKILIGAGGIHPAPQFGKVYAYRFDHGVWGHEQKLTASDETDPSRFGWSVDIDGDRAIIGAPVKNIGSGAAYIFNFQGGIWVEETILHSTDNQILRIFGFDVAIDKFKAIVGAPVAFGYADAGTAYLYGLSNAWTGWNLTQTLQSDTQMGEPIWDWFGYSVEVHNNFAAVGSPIDNIEPSGLGGIGACCFGDGGDCLDNLDETDCGIFEGQYAGEGILCEHINCPVYHPVVYGPGAVSSLWCTIEGPGPGMPVPRQLPNTYTNVKLPGGECIWMECVYPNCPYPNCKK
jgi:hypothetical protein